MEPVILFVNIGRNELFQSTDHYQSDTPEGFVPATVRLPFSAVERRITDKADFIQTLYLDAGFTEIPNPVEAYQP